MVCLDYGKLWFKWHNELFYLIRSRKDLIPHDMIPLIVVATESDILKQKEIGLEMMCNLNATCSLSNFHFF